MNESNEFTPATGSHVKRPPSRPDHSGAARSSCGRCPNCLEHDRLMQDIGMPDVRVTCDHQGSDRANKKDSHE